MIDLAIIAGYLALVLGTGFWLSRRQKTTERYLVAGRDLPWWAVGSSIVATETSTISFISVPGIAYAYGGDFTFLQIVLGYLVGRIVIALLLLPAYFRRTLVTVYQLLREYFGRAVTALAALLFITMRTIADGVRLLLTALVLAAVAAVFAPGVSLTTAIVISILFLGVIMIIFTFLGGIEAVVWVEVAQFLIYVGGAIAAGVVIVQKIPGGLDAAVMLGSEAGKFRVFDMSLTLTSSYVFWAGLVGGAFLTMSTHGTDQFMVQRYLSSRSRAHATAGLLSSAVVVFLQFAGFLFLGVLLFGFYRPDQFVDWASRPAAPFDAPDQVFAHFIANHLPTGLMGLVVAAILAAALSSSLSAIASTALVDLYEPLRPGRGDAHYLRFSRGTVVVAGFAQIAVALALIGGTRSALDVALAVASLLNGPILGVFLLGLTGVRSSRAALIGALAGLLAVTWVWLGTDVAWPWYAVVGSLVTLIVGSVSLALSRAPAAGR